MAKKSVSVKSFAVMSESGSLDEAATLASFTAALDTLIAEETEATAQVAAAVSAVFDANRGKTLLRDELMHKTATLLNAEKLTYTVITNRIKAFLKANSRPSNPEGAYEVVRGPSGGTRRVADVTPEIVVPETTEAVAAE